MSFEDAQKKYLIFVKKRQKKQSFDTIAKDFNSRIVPFFSGMNLDEFKEDKIMEWHDYIENFNFSNKYNHKLYYTLLAFLDYCVSNNWLGYNYLRNIGPFKVHYEEDKHDFYTLKEFNQFLKGFDAKDFIYKTFFTFMFFSGTRPSEAMALKFSDLKGNYVFINKTIHRHGLREFDTPKTHSSIRKILLDDKMVYELLDLKDYYDLKYGKGVDYFIFGGLKPLSCTSVDRHKNMACDKANIRRITVHQFRHSHATLLLQNGMLINEVSRRLGHSKVSTTLNIYTHTNDEQEKRVQGTLNSLRFNFFETIAKDFKNFISILKHISMF